MEKLLYSPAGDQGILIRFGREIDPSVNAGVRAMCDLLSDTPLPGVTEWIPAFSTLLVLYDNRKTTPRALQRRLRSLESRIQPAGSQKKVIHRIPVCYSERFGEDLADVAKHTGLSVSEVIERHCARDYQIYMLGFLPGFAYLGGLDKTIACPRLTSPRKVIPAGSVGIGGDQTGIYPVPSPGGWRLIGRTPVKVYDPQKVQPILYRMGEFIHFFPVTESEYAQIETEVNSGTYTVKQEIREVFQ